MTPTEFVMAPHGSSPAGPCAFCGHPDRRHRMWDTIRKRFSAGESIKALATDYGYAPREIEQWLRLAMTEPKRRKAAK